MALEIPERLNIATRFLDERITDGKGDKVALVAGDRKLTYAEVQRLSNRFAHVVRDLDVDPEQRVLVGLPDIPEFVVALFGTLKNGSVVVMVNCHLKTPEIAYFYDYTRAKVAVVHHDQLAVFREAAEASRDLRTILVVGSGREGELEKLADGRISVQALEPLLQGASDSFDNYPTHRDDAALWLFSGGTTGRPKAVVQTHASFANTTELYAKGVLGYCESDITLSVPKLYFGYATGSNLLFPFSVGATAVLFPERCTADALFAQIRAHRPTILINAPTMVNNLVSHPEAPSQDLSCLRLSTSAGEALPVELYDRWKKAFGVELLDGLGTAEMWHVFVTNRLGDVKPGTLGKVVDGFEVEVRDDEGKPVPHGHVGWLWVRGGSRAIGYWQQMDKSMTAFRGEWYVSGDMIRKDADGYVTYCGRGDDMLKVGGKWLAPGEVENCLLCHDAVKECAVVGVPDEHGLVKPHAHMTLAAELPAEGKERDELIERLKTYVRVKLEPYKAPRHIVFHDALPRTHLGKIDRGKLRQS